MKKLSFTTWTFIAMIIGAILGITCGPIMTQLGFIGTIWLNCIKLIMVPLIFTVMVLAIAKQTNMNMIGRASVRIVVYYAITTLLASLIGLAVAYVVKPGVGLTMSGVNVQTIKASSDITFVNFVKSLFPTAMFKSFANGNALQTLVIGALIGLAIMKMKNQEYKAKAIKAFEVMNDAIYSYIGLIMKVAPVGVLFLIGDSFGKYGPQLFSSMGKWIGSVWIALFIQVLVVYGFFLLTFARVSPFYYLKSTSELWSFTMATCASSAAVPISLGIAQKKYGVKEDIANFCIPLGAQINYDGATIMISTVLVLITQMYGIETNFFMLLRMALVASLVASSGGGVPGNSMVKLMVVCETLGLPTEFVGVVAGFYRLTEMGTSTANSLGDLAGTICVNSMEFGKPQLNVTETNNEDNRKDRITC